MKEVVSELTRALEHVNAHHQHETKSKFLAAQHETIRLGTLLVKRENKIVELTQQLGLHKGAKEQYMPSINRASTVRYSN